MSMKKLVMFRLLIGRLAGCGVLRSARHGTMAFPFKPDDLILWNRRATDAHPGLTRFPLMTLCRHYSVSYEKLKEKAYRLCYITLPEDVKAELSALFMQATEGPCQEPEPKIKKGPKPCTPKQLEDELKYWNDWKKLGKMSKEEAAQKYLALAEKFV